MHSGNVGIENVKAWNDFYQFPSQMNAWRWGGGEGTHGPTWSKKEKQYEN